MGGAARTPVAGQGSFFPTQPGSWQAPGAPTPSFAVQQRFPSTGRRPAQQVGQSVPGSLGPQVASARAGGSIGLGQAPTLSGTPQPIRGAAQLTMSDSARCLSASPQPVRVPSQGQLLDGSDTVVTYAGAPSIDTSARPGPPTPMRGFPPGPVPTMSGLMPMNVGAQPRPLPGGFPGGPGSGLPGKPAGWGPSAEVDVDECFAVDVSCTGTRQTAGGVMTGYAISPSAPRQFSKVGDSGPALLVSTKGFTSGIRYWEILDLVTPPSAKVIFGVGVVPRSAGSGLDIDGDIQRNGGHGAVLTHSDNSNGVRQGDRIGVLLDLTGSTGKLSFFLNGQFAGIPSLTGLPRDRPLLPSFCTSGAQGADARFEVVAPKSLPDLATHCEMERQHLERKRAEQKTEEKAAPAPPSKDMSDPSRMTAEEQLKAVEIATAHVGATVEISSSLENGTEVRLNQGDAILFVDLGVPGDGANWAFAVEDERVLARDRFYTHTEFDQQMQDPSGAQGGKVGLKVAHKFVALRPGRTAFRSRYARSDPPADEWHQVVQIMVVEAPSNMAA